MEEKEIEPVWRLIQEHYEKYLQNRGVELPALRRRGSYTKDALTLVYLTRNYPETQWVSKSDLTAFIRRYHPDTNDVQSARHLGMQKGFYIVSSRRGNFYPPDKPPPSGSAYLLVSLEMPHPAFRSRRAVEGDFEHIKRSYDFRCATCGSREGEENLRYKGQRTYLQAGHRNPHRPLTPDNIIPRCQFCNRPDRNWWIYDERGRVIGVASAQPVIKSIQEVFLSDGEIKKLYDYLHQQYGSSS